MLEKILYIDHSVISLSFKELSFEPATGGSLSYDISDDVKIELAEPNKSETLRFLCEVDIKLKATNTNKETNQEAFNLEASLQLMFEAPENIRTNLTTEFFSENLWFLKNTIHLISHQMISNILGETKFKTISGIIPKSRIS